MEKKKIMLPLSVPGLVKHHLDKTEWEGGSQFCGRFHEDIKIVTGRYHVSHGPAKGFGQNPSGLRDDCDRNCENTRIDPSRSFLRRTLILTEDVYASTKMLRQRLRIETETDRKGVESAG
ncbi:hypothetical protein BaRGS_00014399 [Batillaria attramentaria]|uniref:Uncharacterized protein n=1 Tax=Batillaria attramentaria TaxID=370345 RepID=A0ABD0L4S2_9CAEN